MVVVVRVRVVVREKKRVRPHGEGWYYLGERCVVVRESEGRAGREWGESGSSGSSAVW